MLSRIFSLLARFPTLLWLAKLGRRWFRRRTLGLFTHVLLMLVLAAAVTGFAGWLLWTLAGRPDMHGWGGPGDVVKTALTVTAGLGAVVALVVAYRRQRHTESAERREDTKLFNERFKNAAEQLGSPEPAVRLAGVYAMAGLADDWDAGRQTCVNVLCAYMRMPYTPPQDGDLGERERVVRDAITDTIGERLRAEKPPWSGCAFDFRGVAFDGLDFAGVVLVGGRLDFGGARFSGRVGFGHARFYNALVILTGAVFAGTETTFTDATFMSSRLYLEDVAVTGDRVDLSDAWFDTSTLHWPGGADTPPAGLRLPSGYAAFHRDRPT